MAIGTDGTILAAGGQDSAIRLWDLTDPETEPVVLHGHLDSVEAVTFSPDGSTLVSSGDDATIRLWIARTDTLVDLACQKVRRNLSQSEWARYLPGEEYHQTCESLSPRQ